MQYEIVIVDSITHEFEFGSNENYVLEDGRAIRLDDDVRNYTVQLMPFDKNSLISLNEFALQYGEKAVEKGKLFVYLGDELQHYVGFVFWCQPQG